LAGFSLRRFCGAFCAGVAVVAADARGLAWLANHFEISPTSALPMMTFSIRKRSFSAFPGILLQFGENRFTFAFLILRFDF
jgi:hypothetical protein